MLAIGEELLSGKTRDENLYYLAGELRQLGVRLALGMLVADEPDAIVDSLAYARARADVVITTGGVGPTHDDITLSAVARAFGVGLVPAPALVAAIEAFYGERVNDDLLAMADVPEGAELIQPAPFFLPIFRLDDVYVFPGDPGALRLLFEPWKEALRRTPYHLLRLELDADEGALAPLLRRAQAEQPGVCIGSYPRFDAGAPYRVLVTVEGKDPDAVRTAATVLSREIEARLGASASLRLGPSAADTRPSGPRADEGSDEQ